MICGSSSMRAQLHNTPGDARHVGGIEGGVDLVEHEEGRRPVAVDGKQQRQRGYRLRD